MTPARHPNVQDWGKLLSAPGRWPGLLHAGATPESVARVASGQLYLATPYSLQVTNPVTGRWVRRWSEQVARGAALAQADLAMRGVTAVSPISQSAAMCHIDSRLDPLDERFWARWCDAILWASRAVVVPDLPGWRHSLGVWREVVWALDHSVPVHVYGRAE